MMLKSSSWTPTPSSVRSLASIGTSASLKCSASELQYGDEMTVMIVFGSCAGDGNADGDGSTTAKMALEQVDEEHRFEDPEPIRSSSNP